MRTLLLSLSGIAVLAAVAWSQDTPKPAASDLAAKAMEAMDALESKTSKTTLTPPGSDKRGKNNRETNELKEAGEAKSAKTEADDEDKENNGLPLLPAAPEEDARGMDLMSRSRLDMMVPTGRSHRGVHYPMYRPVETDRTVLDPLLGGVAGVKAPMDSLFESDIVTRLDDDHVQFDRAKWVQFDDKPAADGVARPTMSLEIQRGVYDLKNEILMTNQPVRIENPQMVIEGDTMLHDRASGLTRLTGRVKMTFYNEEEPEPAAAPAVAPAPGKSSAAAPSPQKPSQP